MLSTAEQEQKATPSLHLWPVLVLLGDKTQVSIEVMKAELFLDPVVLGTSEAEPGREFKIDADSVGVRVGPYVQNAIHKKCRSLISESNLLY